MYLIFKIPISQFSSESIKDRVIPLWPKNILIGRVLN